MKSAARPVTRDLWRGLFLGVPLGFSLGGSLAATIFARWGLDGLREDALTIVGLTVYAVVLGFVAAAASSRWTPHEDREAPPVGGLLPACVTRGVVTGAVFAIVLPLALEDWWLVSLQYVAQDRRPVALALFGFWLGILSAPLAVLEKIGRAGFMRRAGVVLAALPLAASAVLGADAVAGFTLRLGWDGSLASNCRAIASETQARLDFDSAINLGGIALGLAFDALLRRRHMSLAAETLLLGLFTALLIPALAAGHTPDSAWGAADMAIAVIVRGSLFLVPLLPLGRHAAAAIERRGFARGATAGLTQLAVLGVAFVWIDARLREGDSIPDHTVELATLWFYGVGLGLLAAFGGGRASSVVPNVEPSSEPAPAAVVRRVLVRGALLGLAFGALGQLLPETLPGLAWVGLQARVLSPRGFDGALRLYPFAFGLVGAAVAWVEARAERRPRGRRRELRALVEVLGLALVSGVAADLSSLHLGALVGEGSFPAAQLGLADTLGVLPREPGAVFGSLLPTVLAGAIGVLVRLRARSVARQTLLATLLAALVAAVVLALEPVAPDLRLLVGASPRILLTLTPLIPLAAQAADRVAGAIEARLDPHALAEALERATAERRAPTTRAPESQSNVALPEVVVTR